MKGFIDIAMPKFSLIQVFIEKPLTLFVAVPVVAVTNIVVSFELMFYVLGWFFTVDLFTGLLASYYEWKKKPTRKDRWFFGKGEGFSSDKAKKLGVKLAVYVVVPLALIKLQKILFIKNFKYESFSEAEFELATIAVIIFCLIEGFSIFHENLPKCGFNLWQSIKKMIGFYKEVKNDLNE